MQIKRVAFALAVSLISGMALAGGKFNGGEGSGFASATASAGLGGSALTFAMPSNRSLERTSAAVNADTLTITDGTPAAITASGDIRITIPASLSFTWNGAPATPVFGGSAPGKVESAVSFENGNKTLVIDVNADFSNGDSLTVAGLSFTNLTQACRAGRLELDIQNDGRVDAWSDRFTGVTVLRSGGPGDGSDSFTMNQDMALVFVPKGSLILIN